MNPHKERIIRAAIANDNWDALEDLLERYQNYIDAPHCNGTDALTPDQLRRIDFALNGPTLTWSEVLTKTAKSHKAKAAAGKASAKALHRAANIKKQTFRNKAKRRNKRAPQGARYSVTKRPLKKKGKP